MKPLVLGLVLLVGSFSLEAQCPTQPLVLGSQDAIDDFSANYPNCTELNVPVFIDELDGPVDNLNGLIQIEYIESLNIQYTHIQDFTGLDNLAQVSEFRLFRNNSLLNFNGLQSLVEVTSFNAIQNDVLSTSQGLDNLASIEYFNLYQNEQLADLNSFTGITNLVSFRVSGNNFNTLSGFENLNNVAEEIFISGESLTNVFELSDVLSSFSGVLYFINNTELSDLSALTNVTNLEKLVIVGSESLTDLSGLENLVQVNDLLRIGFNPELISLEPLMGLTSVGNLDIYENQSLTSLTGFESLEVIEENFYLMDNPVLDDISAINGLSAQGMNQVVIARNSSLSGCDNDFVCQVIFDPEINEEIQGNANGCNSVPQVAARCILDGSNQMAPFDLKFWPSPADNIIYVTVGDLAIQSVTIFNAQGVLMDKTTRVMTQNESMAKFDVSDYASGLYFIEVGTDSGRVHSKFIKQ